MLIVTVQRLRRYHKDLLKLFSGKENSGNFKVATTLQNQGLSTDEKSAIRANIGAGISSFSGNYSDLKGTPTFADYEEGEWTPAIGYTGWKNFYNFTNGRYVRIGNIVFATCEVIPYTQSGSEIIYLSESSLPFSLGSACNIISSQLQNLITGSKENFTYVKMISSFTSDSSKSFDKTQQDPSTYPISIVYRIDI